MNRNWLAASAAITLLTGCADAGTGPSSPASVSLSFSNVRPAASASVAAAVPQADAAGHRLELQRVQLLVREADLKRQEDDACEHEDACEKFRVGPVLVDLPLDNRVVTPFSNTVAPGTYRELALKIQRPEDDSSSARARFLADHPEWPRNATIRVTGTYDAAPFDIFLETRAQVEQVLDPPLVVGATTDPKSINITLQVDVSRWFLGRDGKFVDPRTVGQNRDALRTVEDNVKRSFLALRDDDRNGRDDRPGDDHGNHSGTSNSGNSGSSGSGNSGSGSGGSGSSGGNSGSSNGSGTSGSGGSGSSGSSGSGTSGSGTSGSGTSGSGGTGSGGSGSSGSGSSGSGSGSHGGSSGGSGSGGHGGGDGSHHT